MCLRQLQGQSSTGPKSQVLQCFVGVGAIQWNYWTGSVDIYEAELLTVDYVVVDCRASGATEPMENIFQSVISIEPAREDCTFTGMAAR